MTAEHLERLLRRVHTAKKEGSGVYGQVSMFVRNAESGELILRLRHPNTVLYNGLHSIIRLLAQNTNSGVPALFKIATLRVGTGVVPPTRADEGLGAEVFSMSLLDSDRFEDFSTNKLIITKTLGSAEGNVTDPLTEAGLFMANGEAFARQTHTPVPKTPAVTVIYVWQLGFTA